jgi:hypothetical protein
MVSVNRFRLLEDNYSANTNGYRYKHNNLESDIPPTLNTRKISVRQIRSVAADGLCACLHS